MPERDIKATLKIQTKEAEQNIKGVQRTAETASKSVTTFAQQAQSSLGQVNQTIAAAQQAGGGGLGGIAGLFAKGGAFGVAAGAAAAGAAALFGPGVNIGVEAAKLQSANLVRQNPIFQADAIAQGTRFVAEEQARRETVGGLGLAAAFANDQQFKALGGIVEFQSKLAGLRAEGAERLLQASISGNFNKTVDNSKAMQRLTDAIRNNAVPASTGNLQR